MPETDRRCGPAFPQLLPILESLLDRIARAGVTELTYKSVATALRVTRQVSRLAGNRRRDEALVREGADNAAQWHAVAEDCKQEDPSLQLRMVGKLVDLLHLVENAGQHVGTPRLQALIRSGVCPPSISS